MVPPVPHHADVIAANNLADLLLDADEDVSLALAFAYSAHVRSIGTPYESAVADTLAKALLKTGYGSSALGLAKMATSADPEDPERLLRLGMAYAAAGDIPAALASLSKVREVAPDSPSAATAVRLADTLRAKAAAGDTGVDGPPAGVRAVD